MGDGRRVVTRNHAGETRGHAQVRVMRHSRWTLAKRRAFLEALAVLSNVSAAAEAAGISKVQVYRIRKADPAFRREWATALREGYEALEMELLDRARHGVETPVFFGGKAVGVVRRYSDAVALKLLASHRATVMAERARDGAAPDPERVPPALEEIKAVLAEMRDRRMALEADAARAEAERAAWVAALTVRAPEGDGRALGCRVL